MKKELIILFIILTISTIQTISAFDIPIDCSNTQIQSSWDSIFLESSTSINIFTNNNITENRCTEYFAYKTSGDYVYYLYSIDNSIQKNSTQIIAVKLNATNQFKNNLTNINNIGDINNINFNIDDNSLLRQTPLTLFQLDLAFSSIFSETPESWAEENLDLESDTTYSFETKTSSVLNNITTKGTITINQNYQQTTFEYLRPFTTPPQTCNQSWDCTDYSACINGTQTRVCVDLNNCGNLTGKPAESQNCTNNCTANFTCANWTSCVNGYRTRLCTDQNSCLANKIENMSCSCFPNWNCSDWGECISNIQIRTCIDINSCNNISNKPAITKSCGVACTPNWTCTDWMPKKCPSNTKTQTRNCTDQNNCGTTMGIPEESQGCSNNLGWMFWFVVAIIVILVAGMSWILIERRKRKDEQTKKVEEQYSSPTQPRYTQTKPKSMPAQIPKININSKKPTKPKPKIQPQQKPQQQTRPRPHIRKFRQTKVDPRFRKRKPF